MIGNRRVTSSLAAILAIMGAAAPSIAEEDFTTHPKNAPKPKKEHQRHAGAKELARRAKRMAVQDGLN